MSMALTSTNLAVMVKKDDVLRRHNVIAILSDEIDTYFLCARDRESPHWEKLQDCILCVSA